LILASTALFSYMIAEKVKLVLSHQRNVNIDIISDDAIRFPTVTICNQNPIRLNLCILNIIIIHFVSKSSSFFFSFSSSLACSSFFDRLSFILVFILHLLLLVLLRLVLLRRHHLRFFFLRSFFSISIFLDSSDSFSLTPSPTSSSVSSIVPFNLAFFLRYLCSTSYTSSSIERETDTERET